MASRDATRIEDLLAHADWLRGMAAALVRSEDPEDLVQDTWLSALRSPPEPGVPVKSWLTVVVRNFALRRWRHARVRERAQAGLALAAASHTEPGSVVERAHLQRRLAQQVLALDEPFRTTVLLRYYEGLSSTEIGATLGVPAGTVRWRLKEGLRRLRAGLDEGDGGWRGLLVSMGDRAWLQRQGPTPAAWLPRAVRLALLGAGLAAVGLSTAFRFRQAEPVYTLAGAADGRPASASAVARPRASTQPETKEEDPMMKEKLRKASALVGVVLPALVASADERSQLVPRDQAIAACVEYWGWAYGCKEELADHAVKAASPNPKSEAPATADARRRKVIDELEHAATVEAREKECNAQMERRWKRTPTELQALRACMSAAACADAVACAMPLMDSWKTRAK